MILCFSSISAFRVEEVTENDTSDETSEKTQINPIPTFAGILAILNAVKKAIQEERKEKKIEESDIDRRRSNFIIHGAAEKGENLEEIKAEDNGFVKEILKKLGMVSQLVLERLTKENNVLSRSP